MARVYISSTFKDLREHREEVARALRQVRHEVVSMEQYVAADERPLEVCLADVERCDVYVGIFAWRYGYVPAHGNPDGMSITELEYRRAVASKKTCLIFILQEEVAWPPTLMERGHGADRLQSLKDELKTRHSVDFFRNKDDLAARVIAAIHVAPVPQPPAPQTVTAPPAEELAAGKLVPKLCDRKAQEEEIHDSFTANLRRRPGRPQVYLVHGDDSECHDSLVERLVATRMKEVAKKLWGSQNSVILLKRPGWSYEGELAGRQFELQRRLFSEFESAYLEEDHTATALARLPALALSPLVVIQNRVNAARWDAATDALLKWYLGYWAALDAKQTQPQVVIFLTVVYPPERPAAGWQRLFGAKRFDKARMQARFAGLAAAAAELDIPFKQAGELRPVHSDDLADWFDRFTPGLSRVERDRYRAEIFAEGRGGADERVSMKDIEHRLETIQEKYLVSRGVLAGLPAGGAGGRGAQARAGDF